MSTIYDTFAILERAAIAGERCPVSQWQANAGPMPTKAMVDSGDVTRLAREGKILVEIAGRNWRVVTILVGPNAGKKTAPDPRGGKVWQTIGRTTVRNTSAQRRPLPGPSAPRLIAPHGLRDLKERGR